MTEVSRRAFLGGVGAAIVAAKVPAIAAVEVEPNLILNTAGLTTQESIKLGEYILGCWIRSTKPGSYEIQVRNENRGISIDRTIEIHETDKWFYYHDQGLPPPVQERYEGVVLAKQKEELPKPKYGTGIRNAPGRSIKSFREAKA